MSVTPFTVRMLDDAMRHVEQTEELLAEIARIVDRKDMSSVQIPDLMRQAEIHSRLAQTYAAISMATKED